MLGFSPIAGVPVAGLAGSSSVGVSAVAGPYSAVLGSIQCQPGLLVPADAQVAFTPPIVGPHRRARQLHAYPRQMLRPHGRKSSGRPFASPPVITSTLANQRHRRRTPPQIPPVCLRPHSTRGKGPRFAAAVVIPPTLPQQLGHRHGRLAARPGPERLLRPKQRRRTPWEFATLVQAPPPRRRRSAGSQQRHPDMMAPPRRRRRLAVGASATNLAVLDSYPLAAGFQWW